MFTHQIAMRHCHDGARHRSYRHFEIVFFVVEFVFLLLLFSCIVSEHFSTLTNVIVIIIFFHRSALIVLAIDSFCTYHSLASNIDTLKRLPLYFLLVRLYLYPQLHNKLPATSELSSNRVLVVLLFLVVLSVIGLQCCCTKTSVKKKDTEICGRN